jgi:hypothetical protein
LFVDEGIEPEHAAYFVVEARTNLPAVGTGAGARQIAWLRHGAGSSSPSVFPYGVISISLAPFLNQYKSSQNTSVILEWAQLGLEPSPSFGLRFVNAGVLFNLVDGEFLAWAGISDGIIQVTYFGQGQQNTIAPYPFNDPFDNPSSWFIQIPLAGAATGAFCFGAGLTANALYANFGCAFQFNAPRDTFVYPMFMSTQNYLGMLVRFHPLFPRNPECSRLALDLSGTGPGAPWSKNSLALRATYFYTTAGVPVTLQPCATPGSESPDVFGSPHEFSPPGFAFATHPADDAGDESWAHYLTPSGHFAIVAAGPQSSPTDSVDLMGGLFAQEYLHAAVDDWVEFVPGMPAFAPGFPAGPAGSPISSPQGESTLTSDFTTSWMKYPCGPAHPARSYFSQVSASVYYGKTGRQRFPMAVRSLYSSLESPCGEPIVFPLVPYGGVYASGNNQLSHNTAGQFAAFESQVLTAARHSNIPANPSGPIFLPSHAGNAMVEAARFAFAFGDTPAMPTSHTPQGLLVRLNQGDGSPSAPAGTWNSLLLAVSPDVASPVEGASLTISGPQGSYLIDTTLSNVLMKNQLFLVVSNPSHLGTFANELYLGGFNFKLDVEQGKTLLIFKFNTSASLVELAQQTNQWAAAADFVSDLRAAQDAIFNAIAVADEHAASPGDPFGDFRRIAHAPGWTGILALNCRIDGNGMPLDIQMLLGGVKGQLRAHHFGIDVNKVQGDSTDAELSQSSLFGVIYYQNPTEFSSPPPQLPELDYEVETLAVVFANSVITQFAVQVGLTINQLFGRQTNLVSASSPAPPPNTLLISGQYQKQGEIGTVTFSSDRPFSYEFPGKNGATRVIQEVQVTNASLVPVSSTIESPGTLIKASFSVGGQVFFAQDPFPNSDGLDLFSYGTSGATGAGMSFSGLTADISFVLDPAGKMDPASKTVAANLSRLTFNPTVQSIRPNSLMGALPLQFSRFVYAEDGITQSSTGTTPVHVLQLEGSGQHSGSPSPPATSPYGTSSPKYALEYDLPLGSLGSLSDGVAIMAKLLLAWGPSQVVPDNDGAAVLVQLPSLSAGLFGFTLQGILKTTFGDANLLKVDLASGESVYAILFNNIKLSVFGFSFPPGVVTDFTLFAGTQDSGAPRNTSNIGWFLATHQT